MSNLMETKMIRRTSESLFVILAILMATSAPCQPRSASAAPPNTALVNGHWFNGYSFEPRTVYSVDGRFTSKKPERIDRTLDLTGLWIIPPYADAHNHSIGTGDLALDKLRVQRYLTDGVFYVKMQGNVPVSDEIRKRIGLDQPDSVDAMLAQQLITASGAHPSELNDIFLYPMIYLPGFSKESYEKASIGPVDTPEDLDRKWPAILAQKPDSSKQSFCIRTSTNSASTTLHMGGIGEWIRRLSPKSLRKPTRLICGSRSM